MGEDRKDGWMSSLTSPLLQVGEDRKDGWMSSLTSPLLQVGEDRRMDGCLV